MPDFSLAPQLVVWESTRSCALACAHCRGDANLSSHPDELTTEEGAGLIEQVRAMGAPSLLLSGGDPLSRPDLEELVRRGKAAGLSMDARPAASLNLTRQRLCALQAAGLDHVVLSLDGARASSHDAFRRVPGAFDKVLRAAGWARELGLALRISSCVGGWNWHEFDALTELVAELDPAAWEIGFLVPAGRRARLGGLSAEQFEEAFAKLGPMLRSLPFAVALVEAQHFRRFAEPDRAAGPREVNAGDGLLFVDHRGDIRPSALLPVSCGNVRAGDLAETYRLDALFCGLRDHSRLKGKCGVCGYREACGGSRARAWAATRDAWAEDPACAYRPG